MRPERDAFLSAASCEHVGGQVGMLSRILVVEYLQRSERGLARAGRLQRLSLTALHRGQADFYETAVWNGIVGNQVGRSVVTYHYC